MMCSLKIARLFRDTDFYTIMVHICKDDSTARTTANINKYMSTIEVPPPIPSLMFLPSTSKLLLVGSAFSAIMAGWSEGFVIPRIAIHAPDREVLSGHGVHDDTVPHNNGSDSRSRVRAEFSLIYRKRCIYCKSFHAPTSYCFRLTTGLDWTGLSVIAMGRGRKYRRRDSSTSSSGDNDLEEGEMRVDHDTSVERSGDSSGSEVSDGDEDHGLSEFYKKKKRVDAPEVTLALRKQTLNLYFEELLSHGKLDKDSALVMSKKYFLSEEAYKLLAPPTLSDTKLHCIQTGAAGGIYSRLHGIHVTARSALKIFLRVYECLGETSQAFANYVPVHPYTEEKELAEGFTMLTLTEAKNKVTEEEIDDAMPRDKEGWTAMLKEKIALERVVEANAALHVRLVSDLDIATAVAVLGQANHAASVDLMVVFVSL